MKKLFGCLIVFLMITANSFSQSDDVFYTIQTTDFGSLLEFEFDKDGKPITTSIRNKENRILKLTNFRYEKGLIKVVEISSFQKYPGTRTLKFKYDKNNLIISQKWSSTSESDSDGFYDEDSIVFGYDSKNRVINILDFQNSYSKKYDSLNRIIEERTDWLNLNGYYDIQSFTYLNDKSIVTNTLYNPHGSRTAKTENEFKDGLLIKKKFTGHDSLQPVWIIDYKYSSAGLLKTKTTRFQTQTYLLTYEKAPLQKNIAEQINKILLGDLSPIHFYE